MNPSIKSFNQVFEHYLYKVASQTIDLADAATQTNLMNLLTEVIKWTGPTDLPMSLTHSESSDWELILNQPVNWSAVYQQWIPEIHRAQRERIDQYIKRLELVIAITSMRW